MDVKGPSLPSEMALEAPFTMCDEKVASELRAYLPFFRDGDRCLGACHHDAGGSLTATCVTPSLFAKRSSRGGLKSKRGHNAPSLH